MLSVRHRFYALLLLLAGGCLAPPSAFAQTIPTMTDRTPAPFISLAVRGPLTKEARQTIEALVEPASTSRLIDLISKEAAPVRDVCADGKQCRNLEQAISDATTRRTLPSLNAPKVVQVETKFVNDDGAVKTVTITKDYAVFSEQDPLVRAAMGESATEPLALVQEKLDESGVTPTVPLTPGNLAVIENDLRISGSSERSFRINRLLPADEVNALVQSLRNTASIASLNLTLQPPNTAFLIQAHQVGPICSGVPQNWPFDVEAVKTVMTFNEEIRRFMRLGPPQRSRVLIVDTGLGRVLAQSLGFNKLLYADAVELMMPATLQDSFNGQPKCNDANGNQYWRDVYGTGSGEFALDDSRCRKRDIGMFDIIAPHRRKPGSLQTYNPSHGSFVGTLAAGGPRFITAFVNISDYIGLSFFRLPQASPLETQDIFNEHKDIGNSLDYANAIDADVINMSLKTSKREYFDATQADSALVIAAAGNEAEDLDAFASENRPASIEDKTGRMIVVGALQPDDAHPLWPSSARSASKVHIASPGALITSYDDSGATVCESGTSAAAPLVSFVAAVIKATTGVPRQAIRSRILAASDHVARLENLVEEGRRLNIPAALDLFVDRIELNSGSVLRGWIEPDRGDPLVPVCKDGGEDESVSGSLDALRGRIDLGLLWEWRRGPDGKVKLRHGIDEPFASGSCHALPGKFEFFDTATRGRRDVEWAEINKILPTPFRSVKPAVVR